MNEHARAISERGYTVLPRTHDDATVAAMRARLTAIHEAHGAPPPYASAARALGENAMLNPTGFVIFELLGIAPELAPRLLSPSLLAVARAVLGEDCSLELTGAVISDAGRPFFSWHNHIGGIDVEAQRASGVFPRFARSERLIAVVYLDDVDADGGPLLALPRRITDPTEPPFDLRAPDWDGQVELTFPRGSTLVFEQCTWHAVRPQRREGLRMFVGSYLTSRAAPPTRARDRSLVGFRGGGPLLRSVLREPGPGA
ncbi:MAG: phytanoyl-CoA dioxygenase family protein [Sandaracinaceae bacterium]|nr:phytanoyl-CoA dioxygenase family protein [Sandaracinaceae bacterium]